MRSSDFQDTFQNWEGGGSGKEGGVRERERLICGEENRTYMKLLITIFQDEDGIFIAECPSIPGCVSQGRTEGEAERNVREAIKECIEVRKEKGMPLTVTTKEVHV